MNSKFYARCVDCGAMFRTEDMERYANGDWRCESCNLAVLRSAVDKLADAYNKEDNK